MWPSAKNILLVSQLAVILHGRTSKEVGVDHAAHRTACFVFIQINQQTIRWTRHPLWLAQADVVHWHAREREAERFETWPLDGKFFTCHTFKSGLARHCMKTRQKICCCVNLSVVLSFQAKSFHRGFQLWVHTEHSLQPESLLWSQSSQRGGSRRPIFGPEMQSVRSV